MNGPADTPLTTVALVRSVRPAGSWPVWAEYTTMAEASVRASACALATRARDWMLAYSGNAIAVRIPMMATTIISSMSVKPCLSCILLRQKLNIAVPLIELVLDRLRGRWSCLVPVPRRSAGSVPRYPEILRRRAGGGAQDLPGDM